MSGNRGEYHYPQKEMDFLLRLRFRREWRTVQNVRNTEYIYDVPGKKAITKDTQGSWKWVNLSGPDASLIKDESEKKVTLNEFTKNDKTQAMAEGYVIS